MERYGAQPHLTTSATEMPHQQMLEQLQQKGLPEIALPISTRPPTDLVDEIAATVGVGNYVDDMEQPMAVGEETERGGVMGNRWPRQETLALLKIRSDMDAAFRDATLKGPLWDKVSSMMAEEGYTRSSKKCKEKFENVHKYYKRTRKNCAGTQDGKSYRFFSQLEALQNSTMSSSISVTPTPLPPLQPNQPAVMLGNLQNQQPLSEMQLPPQGGRGGGLGIGAGGASSLFSFSSNTSSSTSLSGSDGEDTAEEATDEGGGSKKRKRCEKSESAGKKMRSFFKGLMQQVLERQENMQRTFLETVEKREQERMVREEAWRRQEMARLNRDHDLVAQERAIAASRDTCIITFLQKITGESVQFPQVPPMNVNITPPPPPYATVALPQSSFQQIPQPPQYVQRQRGETTPRRQPPPITSSDVNTPSRETTATNDSASSSRWPKTEVLALIKVRSEMEPRYQESGPKGPLWEDISSAMQKMGYNRSSKRCKEKWENINKYFKKVKESSKKRPEDSKTCPYFHQLDALYRKKIIGSGGGTSTGGNGQQTGQIETSTEPINPDILPITTLPPAAPTQQTILVHARGASETCGVSESMQVQQLNTSNGDHPQPQCFSERGVSSANDDVMKKPEDTVNLEIIKNYENPEENESEGMTIGDEDNDDDEEDEEDEEKQKTAYKIELQNGGGNSSNNNGNNTTATGAAATTAGSFLAMVK